MAESTSILNLWAYEIKVPTTVALELCRTGGARPTTRGLAGQYDVLAGGILKFRSTIRTILDQAELAPEMEADIKRRWIEWRISMEQARSAQRTNAPYNIPDVEEEH